MSWSYRIVHEVAKDSRGKDAHLYHIREVYVADDDEGSPSWAEASVDNWETLDDLKGTWEMMGQAFDKPVLECDGQTLKEPGQP